VHALTVLDVRYAFCTAASHAVPRWESSGGVVSTEVAPVPYPDDRYQTSLMWWDRQHVLELMTGRQLRAVVSELALLWPSTVTRSPWVA
jgi:hypothetical protein